LADFRMALTGMRQLAPIEFFGKFSEKGSR
jgi:hypothetical protein